MVLRKAVAVGGNECPSWQDMRYKEGQTEKVQRRNRMCLHLLHFESQQGRSSACQQYHNPRRCLPDGAPCLMCDKHTRQSRELAVSWSLSGRETRAQPNPWQVPVHWKSTYGIDQKWFSWKSEEVSKECPWLHGPFSVRRLCVVSYFLPKG